MNKLTLTPAELEQLGCTAEQGAELLRRRAQRNRRALLAELAADLPKLQTSEDFKRGLAGRTLNGISYGAQVVQARPTPSSDDDVAVLRHDDGRSLTLVGEDGERVVFLKGQVLSYLTREQFDAVGVQGGAWTRDIVFCTKLLPDLRAMIKAGFEDPIHDVTKGRARYEWESENDPASIDRYVEAVIATTTDRALLEGWLAAAGDEQHGIAIRQRVDKLFAHTDPNFWGGKDDRTRGASAVGHYKVATRG